MKYISIIFLVFLLNSSTSMSKEVIPQETWKNINKVLSSPVSCKENVKMKTQTEKLNKYIQILKKQVEEKESIIMQLRKEVSELNYVKANKKWAELDG